MSVLLYILSANLDSIGVGFSYSARKIHIVRKSLLIIAIFSALCSAFAILAGALLGGILAPETSSRLGDAILFFLGIWLIISACVPDNQKKERSFSIKPLGITVSIIRDPLLCDFDDSSKIEGREAIYLAVALSLDSVAIGLGLGISGIFHWYLPVLIGLSHYVFLEIGRFLGTVLIKKCRVSHKTWTALAGVCLILLAVFG